MKNDYLCKISTWSVWYGEGLIRTAYLILVCWSIISILVSIDSRASTVSFCERYNIMYVMLAIPLLILNVMANVEVRPSSHQRFTMEPKNETVEVGSRVTLPCRAINNQGHVQWTKNNFGLGTLSEYPRYSMMGSDEEGELLSYIKKRRSPMALRSTCRKAKHDRPNNCQGRLVNRSWPKRSYSCYYIKLIIWKHNF
jgi:Fe-S cluster assembly scaffold protein SufB